MIKKLIKLSDTLDSMGLYNEADMLDSLVKLSSEIKTVWVRERPDSDEGITLPIYSKKGDYGWMVGPADWMMKGTRERWYDESKGTPKVQRLENIGFVFENSEEFTKVKLHRGSQTHAGNI